MSGNRYLEFDSTFRNRNMYPYPSEFVVNISQSGINDRYRALDPVSDSAPILTWTNSFRENTGTNYISGITVSPTGATGAETTYGNTVFKIDTSTSGNYQQLRQVKDFYNGASIVIEPSGAGVIARRILGYQPLNVYNAMVTLDTALPDAYVGSTGYFISNPTPVPTNNATGYVKFFIPTGVQADNYYANYLLENISQNEARTITEYDGLTRLATLNTGTTLDWGAIGFDNNYAIRKVLPSATGPLVSFSTTSAQLNSVASNVPDVYTGGFLRLLQMTGSPPFSSITGPFMEQNRIVRYITGDGTFTSISGTTAVLSVGASTENDYYKGALITDVTAGGGNSKTTLILGYTGSTRTAILNSAISGASAGDTWIIRTAVLANPYSVVPIPNTAYEVENFTRDNAVPFTYTGSLTSSQEEVCYEIELLNLILPNTVLISGRGGRPIFYPYLYVELQQISGPSGGNRNIIQSNNPNSTKMLFRAVVDDTPVPLISPFIKIDGDGMVHTVKFKPNDSFKFSVRHPNTGELFRTSANDFYSPTETNPLVQISACFAFKRI